MKDTIEQLKKDEEELEKRMFGTPESKATTEDTATEPKVDTEKAPAKEEELVTWKPEPVDDEQLKVQTDDWEKRYKNLRASRDQKLYEAKSQLSAALSTINTLQAQVNELRAAAPSVDPLSEVFTQEDTENLGEATVDAMRRATRKATEAATKPLKEQLERERKAREEDNKRLAERSKQEAYEIFLQRIATAVPNWEAINFDPAFIQWMEDDDFDGTPRKTYFAQAEAQGNSALIIRYMREFEGSKPAPKKDKLADKITPTGEGSGATQPKQKNGPEIIYRAEIDKFYSDLARGVYAGRHDEARNIEAKIDKAMMEGRIR